MRLPGLGPKTAREIWQELGDHDLAELRAAAEAQQLRTLPGLGAKTEENDPARRSPREPSRPEPRRPLLGHGAAGACSRSSRCCASTRPPI